MKKSLAIAVMALAVPAFVFAFFQPVTLTNGVKRVAVFTQAEANALFSKGFTLEKKFGANPGDTFYGRLFTLGGVTTGGSIASISTTSAAYTLSANEVCKNGSIKFTPLAAATTVTLPASSTGMFATCLPSVGSSIDINYESVATSTTLAAGAGGTLGYTSASSVAAGKYGIIRLFRNGTATYRAYLVNIPN